MKGDIYNIVYILDSQVRTPLPNPESSIYRQAYCCRATVTVTMQGDRYSIAYFANGRARTILQGPKKTYPPIKFEQIVAQKSKYLTEDEMTSDEKYVEWQKKTA